MALTEECCGHHLRRKRLVRRWLSKAGKRGRESLVKFFRVAPECWPCVFFSLNSLAASSSLLFSSLSFFRSSPWSAYIGSGAARFACIHICFHSNAGGQISRHVGNTHALQFFYFLLHVRRESLNPVFACAAD
jgi:hypothetical protein